MVKHQNDALDTRSQERLALFLLVGQAFFFGLALGLLYVVGNTLFLVEYGAEMLPYVYIALGILVSLLFYGLATLQKHWSLNTLSVLTLSLFTIGTFLAWWRLSWHDARWVSFALMLAFPLGAQIFFVIIGGLAGRLLDVRQMKRLFSRIVSGAAGGVICGGLLATPLLNQVNKPEHLLPFAGIGVAIALLLMLVTFSRFPGRLAPAKVETETQVGSSILPLFKERFVTATFLYQMFSAIGTQLVIYIFITQAEVQYPDAQDLAIFFGNFAGLRNVVNIIFLMFLAGPLLNRFGLRFGLAANPGGVAIMVTLLSLFAISLGPTGSIFFWLIAVTYIIDNFLSDGITSASIKTTYQVLPAQNRSVVETMVEGIGVPMAIGLSGVILLIFNGNLGLTLTQIVFFTLAVSLVWLAMSLFVYRDYPRMLIQVLKTRDLDWAGVVVVDSSSIAMLEKNLTSPQAGVALYALDGLADVAPDRLPTYLIKSLDHPQLEVRLEVLRRIEALGLTETIPMLQQRFTGEGSAAVQGAMLRTMAALDEESLFDEIYPYLDDSNSHLRQGALVGLLRSGEFEGIAAAAVKLTQSLNSSKPRERIFVAQVLAESEIAGFYRPLLQLMQDESPDVQRTALLTAGKLKQPKLWPAIVACLGVPQLRTTAITALVNGGEAVVPHLDAALTQPGQDRQILIRLAQILGRIGGKQARSILQKQIDYPDEQVRTQILLALNKCGYQADSKAVAQIQDMLQAELAQATWLVACLIDLGQAEATDLLRTSLAVQLTRHRLRVLLWLSFLYDPQAIRQVQNALGLGRSLNGTPSAQTNRQKSYALETLDVLLPANQKAIILPLAEGLPLDQLLSQLTPHFPQQSHSTETRLQEIVTGPERWLTPWIKAAALDAIVRLPALALSNIVVPLLSSPDPVIWETALLTLHRLNPTQVEDYLGKMADDPNPQIADLARQLASPQKVDIPNLSVVEKVIALKTFSFFVDIPYETLAEIAPTLKEETVRAGEPIFSKGDVGHSVYIITQGEVRIHIGPRTIAKLNQYESFGEMSILDPNFRSTSATARKDSHLLHLDQAPFREILTDHSEISWQVIQILVRRLRQTQDQAGSQRDPANLLGSLKKKLAVHELERG